MAPSGLTIQDLWAALQPRPFQPNPNQEQAILHTEGPLFLTAGPGSGKTRVLLWRTLNLIVFHDVKPEEIFLSTFTEKAAFQLQEGLRAILGLVTNLTGTPYDLSRMYVGTVHSLCQRLIIDRRFSNGGRRPVSPTLKDSLEQYFYLSDRRFWEAATAAAGLSPEANQTITQYLNGSPSSSQHNAVKCCLSLFNRFSEECLDPAEIRERTDDVILKSLIDLYDYYKRSLLTPDRGAPQSDFSLLQQIAMHRLQQSHLSETVFKHVIIDEYQDTNTIQESLFFKLASGNKNLCVVGDDDQALYRFRGATVENFVQFPERCQQHWSIDVTPIPLNTNYRSRQRIVEFYTDFISRHNWQRTSGSGQYRLADKDIRAHSTDAQASVIASTAGHPDDVTAEIADLVKRLIDEGKVQNPNQIAFLFPSLKSAQVTRMIAALENVGLRAYAPRAGRFLEVEEAVSVFGIFLKVFGRPEQGSFPGADYGDFQSWMTGCLRDAETLLRSDRQLAAYVTERQQEIAMLVRDYQILQGVVQQNGWDSNQPYDINRMKRLLYNASGLSDRTKKGLGSAFFERIVERRIQEGQPFSLAYILNRTTALDWSVLDLFYRLCGFSPFKQMFDLAERGEDEGPICNLGLITQYLARFIDSSGAVITASFLSDGKFRNTFFMRFLFSLFRLGEAEYEDADDPFPKGRIPFLTVHQSKGLEFPVVILGNPRKDDKGPQTVERIVRPLLDREGESLDRMSGFDIMRMFYVALSRAKNLLVIAQYSGRGQSTSEPFKTMLADRNFPRIPTFDVNTLPAAQLEAEDLTRNYSYTSDYLLYQKCPRQYMVFRKYGFVASRSQTQVFGNLVHQTIEDLHHLFIARREQP